MNDEDRPDLPVVLRAATAIGLLAAVLGTTLLAWMADTTLNADVDVAVNTQAAGADPQTAREIVTALRGATGNER